MASPPSSAIAGAAAAASRLADVVADLARALPIPTAEAQAASSACRRIGWISAPRVLGPVDVAAIAASLVGTVQAVARAGEAADAAAGLYAAAAATQGCAPSSASPALTRSYSLARALCVAVEMACLGEAFVAEARTGFADRQSASAARVRIRAAYDGAADRVAAALGQDVLAILDTAARETSAYLVQEAASLQPVIRVDAAASFPAASLAWSLYGDPERAGELMDRNAVGTPFHMPATIEAVSPGKR
ncbi:hypothetical protein [Methylobacterium sp. E-066]|uniref:hypothetical protein n=1 Tax=Methylobacterium sp. E-066 TaxID=2836584 RepID=UPI001FB997FB|nr:hypothetical protein [Methylobacterium sp. E-066]MCJ2143742.1 hypothetical protein [Methylobacterium sp. E-066]